MRTGIPTTLALSSLVLASPAGAAEPWGSARTVERASAGATLAAPAVGVDERGYIVAAWTRRLDGRTALFGARRTPRRGFADPFLLERPLERIDGTAVEFDGRRNALVGYRRSSGDGLRIGATTVRANGARTRRVVFVDGRPPSTPRFADPPFDRPLLAWTAATGDPDLQVAEARADGSFDATVRFDLDGAIRPVAVATEPRGRGLLAYVRRDGDARRVVVGRRISGTTRFAVTPVSAAGATPRSPAIAVTRTGRAVVAWLQGDTVMAAERPAGATAFSAPRTVAGSARGALRAVATGDGTVLLAWLSTGGELRAGDLDGPVRRVSRAGAPLDDYVLRTGGRGGATAAWIEEAGGAGGVVRAAAITATGRVGKVQRLSPSGRRAGSLALGVGERGDAVATWTDADGDRVRGARRPA